MTADTLLERADEQRQRGNLELAEALYVQAIEAGDEGEGIVTLTRARLRLAEVLLELDRPEEADPLLGKVMRTERDGGIIRAEVKAAARLMSQVRGWSA
jgi:thioredoxin-like negative regulator of GroEL